MRYINVVARRRAAETATPDASPSIWGMDVTGGRKRDAMWELRDAGELARAASVLRDLPSLVSLASHLPRRY